MRSIITSHPKACVLRGRCVLSDGCFAEFCGDAAASGRYKQQKSRDLKGRSSFGAGGGTRTHTLSPGTDFESVTSTIPSRRLMQFALKTLYKTKTENSRTIFAEH